MSHSVVIVQLPLVFAVDDEPARAGLFPEDPDRAVQGRPGRAVSGIKGVVDLASRIREAELIETLALPGPELAEPFALLGRDQLEDRVGRRVEVILAVRAHLVGIDRDVGLPAQVGRDPGAGLDLGLKEPIAVHVEEVMVESAARPTAALVRRQAARDRGRRRGSLDGS